MLTHVRWASALALVAAAGLPALAQQAQPADLKAKAAQFVPVAAHSEPLFNAFTPAKAPARIPEQATRMNPVKVNLNLLSGLGATDHVGLNMFDDAQYELVVDRVERRSATSFSVFGKIEGLPESLVILVRQDDAVVGMIHAPTFGKTFRIFHQEDGFSLLCQTDANKYPSCGGSVPTDPNDFDAILDHKDAVDQGLTLPDDIQNVVNSLPPPPATCFNQGTVFDVLIAYTQAAQNAAGGASAIQGECQMAIDAANTAYNNSGVASRARLVHRTWTNDNESGTWDDILNRLTSTNDGAMDEIHSLRNTYRADFCVLLINRGEYCGLGWCTSDDTKAFCIVNWGCSADNWSMAHEMGHNQGCDHDRQNSGGGCTNYSYGYGFRWYGNSGNQYRSVMAYAPGQRVAHFSNPSVTFDGVATGVASGGSAANNTAVINDRRGTCEGFRLSGYTVWVDFGNAGGFQFGTYSFPDATPGLGVATISPLGAGASEWPSLIFKSGSRYTSNPITISKTMTLKACGGPVTIGHN